MTEEAEKPFKDPVQSLEAKSRLIVHFGFDERLSDKLSHDCTESCMPIDDVAISWVPSCRQPARCRELETNEKYEHVASFWRMFRISSSYRTNVFLSKRSVLFVRDLMCLYGTTAAVNHNGLVTDLEGVLNKTLQLKKGS